MKKNLLLMEKGSEIRSAIQELSLLKAEGLISTKPFLNVCNMVLQVLGWFSLPPLSLAMWSNQYLLDTIKDYALSTFLKQNPIPFYGNDHGSSILSNLSCLGTHILSLFLSLYCYTVKRDGSSLGCLLPIKILFF